MAMTSLLYGVLGQAYGAGSYNSSTYDSGSTTATSTAGGTIGGGLTNTGIAVASIVTVAALLLLIAIVVRIWRRPNKHTIVASESENER